MGEAFIDIGAMQLLKLALPESAIVYVSGMAHYYVKSRHAEKCAKPQQVIAKSLGVHYEIAINRRPAMAPMVDLSQLAHQGISLKADIFALGGMFATEEFVETGAAKYWIAPLFKKNKSMRSVFIGLGGEKYTKEEVDKFASFLPVMRVLGIITRDDKAHDFYKQKLSPCFRGIDCAFFVSEAYSPVGFAVEPYDVMAFSRMAKPPSFEKWNKKIVRAEHMFYHTTCPDDFRDYFISDSPYDYLTLYANCSEVHTDLVHATIIALMYGKRVKYYDASKRALAFDAVGATIDKDGFLSLDPSILAIRKAEMIEHLREIVGRI
ncbi:MAG: polysaccharide pyruvyl transferase family protein [Deltaproteobacteria bacterium]